MYKLKYTSNFEDELENLDKPVQRRVLSKLEHLAKNPKLARPFKYLPDELEGLKK